MVRWIAIGAAACAGRDVDRPTDADPDSDSDPCGADPALAVTMSIAAGPLPSTLALAVDTSAPATVAVRCVADLDPTEVHLVEDPVAGTGHALHLLGLLSDTAYTCQAAATCPTTGAPPASASFTTGSPPQPLPVLEVEVDPALGMTGAYTLGGWERADAVPFRTWLIVWDPQGRPRWAWRLPEGVRVSVEALLDPPPPGEAASTTLVWGGGNDSDGAPRIVDLWDGERYAADLPPWGADYWSHDAKRLDDGRILSLQYVPNVDRTGLIAFLGFGLRVHDPVTGRLDVELDSQRYVDDGLLSPGALGSEPYHANWVDRQETADGPRLYVSLCEVQKILAIDEATGDVVWDLSADAGWTVVDELGAPLGPEVLPQCAHGLEVDGDDLLVYDNGRDRGQSQAIRWHVDAATHTLSRVWAWTERGWDLPTLGDLDDLGNDRILVTEAAEGSLDAPATAFVEVDLATGAVASRLSMPRGFRHVGYRGERYDGCALFANTATCPALAARATALAPLFAER
ncbi:MAG: hypothetical protein ABMB14_26005 [Myxococcota bacterium]